MAGRNFGCGSSREHAPISLLNMGAVAVKVEETGEVLQCEKLGDQAMKILEAGGIKAMMRARFAE